MKKPVVIIVSRERKLRESAKKAIETASKDIDIDFEISGYESRKYKGGKINDAQLYVTTSLDPASNEQRIARGLKGTGCARILYTDMPKLLEEHINDPKSSLFSGYLRHTKESSHRKIVPKNFEIWFSENKRTTFDEIVLGGETNLIEKEFQEAIERVRKARKMRQQLNIGVVGLGKLGRQIVHDLKSKPFVESVNAFTNFAKDDYEGIIIPRMAFEGDQRRKFHFHESIDSLLETNPDPLIICTGEWAENIRYENFKEIEKLTERLMDGAYKKVRDILKTIKDFQTKGYNGLICMESNPTGTLLQVAKRMGIDPMTLTSITPDMSRHKTLLLQKLAKRDPTLKYSDIELRVIGEHGKEIPLLKEARVRGKPLRKVCSKFRNKAYRRAFIDEARGIGLKLMKVSEELGDNYGGTPDKIVEHLGDFAHLQRMIPSAYSYFNKEDDCFIGSPSIVSYPLRVRSTSESLNELSHDEEVRKELRETIEYQKKLADKYHQEAS